MKPERGAAPVASLDSLPADEAWFVRALRLWSDGPDSQAAVWNEVAMRFGPARGSQFLNRFEDLLGLVLRQSRRPVLMHHTTCNCVGADEAVFAHFVATATTGEREDAMLIATLLLRADVAPVAVSLAQTLGLELRRSLVTAAGPAPGATLH